MQSDAVSRRRTEIMHATAARDGRCDACGQKVALLFEVGQHLVCRRCRDGEA